MKAPGPGHRSPPVNGKPGWSSLPDARPPANPLRPSGPPPHRSFRSLGEKVAPSPARRPARADVGGSTPKGGGGSVLPGPRPKGCGSRSARCDTSGRRPKADSRWLHGGWAQFWLRGTMWWSRYRQDPRSPESPGSRGGAPVRELMPRTHSRERMLRRRYPLARRRSRPPEFLQTLESDLLREISLRASIATAGFVTGPVPLRPIFPVRPGGS